MKQKTEKEWGDVKLVAELTKKSYVYVSMVLRGDRQSKLIVDTQQRLNEARKEMLKGVMEGVP
jgi:hypothetical protein